MKLVYLALQIVSLFVALSANAQALCPELFRSDKSVDSLIFEGAVFDREAGIEKLKEFFGAEEQVDDQNITLMFMMDLEAKDFESIEKPRKSITVQLILEKLKQEKVFQFFVHSEDNYAPFLDVSSLFHINGKASVETNDIVQHVKRLHKRKLTEALELMNVVMDRVTIAQTGRSLSIEVVRTLNAFETPSYTTSTIRFTKDVSGKIVNVQISRIDHRGAVRQTTFENYAVATTIKLDP